MWEKIKSWFKSEKTVVEGKLIDELTLATPYLADELDNLKAEPSVAFLTLPSQQQAALIIVKVQAILKNELGIGG